MDGFFLLFFLSPFVKGEAEGRGIYKLSLNPPPLRGSPPLQRRTNMLFFLPEEIRIDQT